jgi:hypothetical protein
MSRGATYGPTGLLGLGNQGRGRSPPLGARPAPTAARPSRRQRKRRQPMLALGCAGTGCHLTAEAGSWYAFMARRPAHRYDGAASNARRSLARRCGDPRVPRLGPKCWGVLQPNPASTHLQNQITARRPVPRSGHRHAQHGTRCRRAGLCQRRGRGQGALGCGRPELTRAYNLQKQIPWHEGRLSGMPVAAHGTTPSASALGFTTARSWPRRGGVRPVRTHARRRVRLQGNSTAH